jgi:hypothetical protein
MIAARHHAPYKETVFAGTDTQSVARADSHSIKEKEPAVKAKKRVLFYGIITTADRKYVFS